MKLKRQILVTAVLVGATAGLAAGVIKTFWNIGEEKIKEKAMKTPAEGEAEEESEAQEAETAPSENEAEGKKPEEKETEEASENHESEEALEEQKAKEAPENHGAVTESGKGAQ